MPKVIQAVYENGVFKPVGKIDLWEHQQVEIETAQGFQPHNVCMPDVIATLTIGQ